MISEYFMLQSFPLNFPKFLNSSILHPSILAEIVVSFPFPLLDLSNGFHEQFQNEGKGMCYYVFFQITLSLLHFPFMLLFLPRNSQSHNLRNFQKFNFPVLNLTSYILFWLLQSTTGFDRWYPQKKERFAESQHMKESPETSKLLSDKSALITRKHHPAYLSSALKQNHIPTVEGHLRRQKLCNYILLGITRWV